MRKRIRPLLQSLGRGHLEKLLRAALRAVNPHCVLSFSQEGEDIVLRRLLDKSTPGFFVDVGAHHPIRFSNTCLYYDMGWHGINIEPSPDAMALFGKHRSRDVNLQRGIAEATGTLTYFVFDDPALNTFDPQLVRDREDQTRYRVIQTIPIAVERLDAILAKHLPPTQAIDFLSIDAEGFDLQVLRSNDWRRFRPEFVLVEALGFRLVNASEHPLHVFMQDVGYELVAKTLNTLFFHNKR